MQWRKFQIFNLEEVFFNFFVFWAVWGLIFATFFQCRRIGPRSQAHIDQQQLQITILRGHGMWQYDKVCQKNSYPIRPLLLEASNYIYVICALSWLYILLNRLSISVQKILIFKDLSVWRAKTLQSCWSIRIYSQVNYSSFLFCFRLSLWVLFSVNFLSGTDLFCLFLELDLCL